MVHEFRSARSHFRLGMVLTVLVTCAALGAGIGVFLEQPRTAEIAVRVVGSLVMAGLWLPFILLGLWQILEWHRSRLLIGARSVVLRSAMRIRKVSFHEVVSARWVLNRALRLKSPRGRTTIPISEFKAYQQEQIVRLLHERIDLSVQEDWETMEHRATPQHLDSRQHNQEFLRLARVLPIGLVLGPLAGAVLQYLYGYHEALGWKGNLFFVGTFGGLVSIATLLLAGIMLWWMTQPEPAPTIQAGERDERLGARGE